MGQYHPNLNRVRRRVPLADVRAGCQPLSAVSLLGVSHGPGKHREFLRNANNASKKFRHFSWKKIYQNKKIALPCSDLNHIE
jgi:hypothetical protein